MIFCEAGRRRSSLMRPYLKTAIPGELRPPRLPARWTRTAATGHASVVTHIVRYLTDTDARPRVGIRDAAGLRPLDVPSLGSLLAQPGGAIRAAVAAGQAAPPPGGPPPGAPPPGAPPPGAPAGGQVILLPPADGRMEIWAAGVTYRRSREARLEESGGADFYQRVYDAARPELFFKSVPWRVVTDTEPIAVRRDSALNVPEAELAIVVNSAADIVGYTVCNDVSSRAIEGENPLYLPQAKIYAGACALAGHPPGVGDRRERPRDQPADHQGGHRRLVRRYPHQPAQPATPEPGRLPVRRGELPRRRDHLDRDGNRPGD